jgi:hypothetical protein
MNEICESWISPWRKMQENLAIEFGAESSHGGSTPADTIPNSNRTVVPGASWLARARSRQD